jgi:hypothetical protein
MISSQIDESAAVAVEDDLPGGGFHFRTMRRDPK